MSVPRQRSKRRYAARLRVAGAIPAALVALLLAWAAFGVERAGAEPLERSLTLESATPTSLVVTWDEVAGTTLYTVQWRRADEPELGGFHAEVDGRHEITGLLPGREYVIRIQASSGGGVTLAWIRARLAPSEACHFQHARRRLDLHQRAAAADPERRFARASLHVNPV
ncbi:MAG: fibronectin type III domain-containing protein [Chloroflexota bacterium]|nr:fibronectin type III domain-containing protein [Chloroflexota bacterium]